MKRWMSPMAGQQEGGTYGEIAWSAEEVNDTSRSQPSSHMCYKKKSSIKGAIPDFYKLDQELQTGCRSAQEKVRCSRPRSPSETSGIQQTETEIVIVQQLAALTIRDTEPLAG
ncbi:hypothetical protein Y1Q_0012997 [Alligator mississippiensis]|uniref:Uncharacterized protein n=1 Tax=Alligator mississippiensis TaxID=8496 RepID=A0A151NCD0_ALLMI|nr:hypothetical protein Y1Q_0012997 [Alligator mississippiensis]